MNYGEDPMMDYGKDPYTDRPRRTSSKAKSKDPKAEKEAAPREREPSKQLRPVPDKMDIDRKGEESEEGEIAE